MSALTNAYAAAAAIIAAWDSWTDGAESASDDILQSAVRHAALLLNRAPRQIPEEMRIPFEEAIAVISADPVEPPDNIPNLTFDEAIEPLRRFIACAK